MDHPFAAPSTRRRGLFGVQTEATYLPLVKDIRTRLRHDDDVYEQFLDDFRLHHTAQSRAETLRSYA